jgi:hypothetical protein
MKGWGGGGAKTREKGGQGSNVGGMYSRDERVQFQVNDGG